MLELNTPVAGAGCSLVRAMKILKGVSGATSAAPEHLPTAAELPPSTAAASLNRREPS